MAPRLWLAILMTLVGCLVAGCSALPPPPAASNQEVSAPSAAEARSFEATQTSIAPATGEQAEILLQLREGGGLAAVGATELPRWTLYQDGLVVWTETGAPTVGFTQHVWIGRLDEQQVAALVALADEVGFWELDASYGVGATTPSSDTLVVQIAPPDLPSSTLALRLAERQHEVLVYPADEAQMPEGYRALRAQMLATRPADATPFIPATFRLEARDLGAVSTLTEGQRAPLVAWPFDELRLAHNTTAPLYLGGEMGGKVSAFIASEGANVIQEERAYTLGFYANPPRAVTP